VLLQDPAVVNQKNIDAVERGVVDPQHAVQRFGARYPQRQVQPYGMRLFAEIARGAHGLLHVGAPREHVLHVQPVLGVDKHPNRRPQRLGRLHADLHKLARAGTRAQAQPGPQQQQSTSRHLGFSTPPDLT
jgi:hypothetical protein